MSETLKKTKAGAGRDKADLVFKWAAMLCAVTLLLIVAAMAVSLIWESNLSLEKFGFGFIISQEWDPVAGDFGALTSIFGTIVSAMIAMIIAVPLSLIISLFLVELAPPSVSRIVGGGIELLAAVPSIIYGMWGLFMFAPFMADYVQPLLQDHLGFLPLFTGPPMGIGMLTSGIILALMVLPFISAVTRDIFKMVPSVVKESAYGMGSTTWETTRHVTIRYGIKGILGACFLGLGRAIGETMAVTFVIGNNHDISPSLFSAGNSIASTLANEFSEASEPLYLSSLVELGLVLLGITFVIQIIAHFWLKKMENSSGVGL